MTGQIEIEAHLELLYNQLSELGNRREHGLSDEEYYPAYVELDTAIRKAEALLRYHPDGEPVCDCAGPNDRPGCQSCKQAAAAVYEIEY